MEWHHVFLALHAALALGALGLAVFARRQVLGFLATLWLLAGLALPLFFGAGADRDLAERALALGPLAGPVFFGALALKFPVLVAPILAVALYVAYLVLAGFDLLKLTSLSALAGAALFALTALAGAEAGVSLLIRARAAALAEGAYCLDQKRVHAMLAEATRAERRPHATLVDGDMTFMWSFADRDFVPQTNERFVVRGGERSCLPPRRAQRRPNSFSMSASFSST